MTACLDGKLIDSENSFQKEYVLPPTIQANNSNCVEIDVQPSKEEKGIPRPPQAFIVNLQANDPDEVSLLFLQCEMPFFSMPNGQDA